MNVVGELQRKRTLAASRGFLAAARLSCLSYERTNLKYEIKPTAAVSIMTPVIFFTFFKFSCYHYNLTFAPWIMCHSECLQCPKAGEQQNFSIGTSRQNSSITLTLLSAPLFAVSPESTNMTVCEMFIWTEEGLRSQVFLLAISCPNVPNCRT